MEEAKKENNINLMFLVPLIVAQVKKDLLKAGKQEPWGVILFQRKVYWFQTAILHDFSTTPPNHQIEKVYVRVSDETCSIEGLPVLILASHILSADRVGGSTVQIGFIDEGGKSRLENIEVPSVSCSHLANRALQSAA